MPARAASSPRRIPSRSFRLACLGCLPERKVARVALARFHGGVDLRLVFGGAHIVELLAGQRPVIVLAGDGEVDVALAVGVGVLALDQAVNQVNLVRNMPGRVRFVGRWQNTEGRIRFGEFTLETLRPGPPFNARVGGLVEDLVINVGDVTDVSDVQTIALQPTNQRVERDGRAQVSDVWRTLHRRAT